MTKKLLLFLIFFTFVHFNILLSSSEKICIDDYSYKDGLTTSGVNSTFKDSKGFIWLCSLNGLYRFDGYNFRKISALVNGVPNYETVCITEDNEQNLWIGTASKGILHYNTHTEKVSNVSLSIKCNIRISKIHFFNDKIWVATGNGLFVITPEVKFNENSTLKTIVLYPDPSNIIPQKNKINTLFSNPKSDILWVGTNGSLYSLNTRKFDFEYVNTYPQNAINCISGNETSIIAGSWDGGVFQLNTTSRKIENDAFIVEVNKILYNKRVISVFFDDRQRLWAATYGSGLYIFEKDPQGKLNYVNYRNDEQNKESIKSDFINHMYLDNSGIVWLGMNQPALSKIYSEKSNLDYIDFSNSLTEKTKEIVSVSQAIDKDKIWISTNGQGLVLFDTKTKKYTRFTSNPSSALRLADDEVCLCFQDKTGNLWIVLRRNGLYIVPAKDAAKLVSGKNTSQIHPIDANTFLGNDTRQNLYIIHFYQDSENRIWIGLWGTLYLVELKQGFSNSLNINELKGYSEITCIYSDQYPEKTNIPISPVFSILEVQPHRYFLGTRNTGIVQLYENEKNKFTYKYLSINEKLPGDNINCITKDKRNAIWIGTTSGLCYWNEGSNTFKSITEKEGLASENINNIIEYDDSNIWISTSYGISEIHRENFLVKNYFFTDKEKFNHYILNAAIKTEDKYIYFSSTDALVSINPNFLKSVANDPPLYFTDIKIDNKTVNPFEKYNGTEVINANINECKTINVPFNHTLSLEFAALEYINPQRMLYKYKLGKNGNWVLVKSNQRNISLAGMKPGEYLLSIVLANTTKGNIERTLKINYLPPFWQSKPALLIYFLLLILIFLVYRRITIQRVMQKSVIENERTERKKLEELDKMKSEFFSNISHEFRTPLSLIINPLERLSRENDISDKNKERIGLILKSSNRLLKLTNELMDFSKVEKKLLVPNFQSCEMVSFVNDICRLFNNQADALNIDFKLNSAVERIDIPIDKGMIEKVVFNLLSNAFKYTPENGVVMVNISKEKIADAEYIKISVINSGEGISGENLDKVFDRYYQVNNVQNQKVEGTGIGLSLVKSFVELHNGSVEVKSTPNLETCFDIFLPVHQSVASYENVLNASTHSESTQDAILNAESKLNENKPTSHYRLLLVEDEDDIRSFIIEELSADFNVTAATNGEDGIKLANELIPDLIITDVMMPIVSGIDLCNTLKNQMSTSHIPIIILSAKTSVEQQIEGLEMGADVYMIKPFSIEHLKIQILRLINFKEKIYSRYLKETTLIPEGALVTKLDEVFMTKIMTYIDDNLTNSNLSVDHLASSVSLSKVQTYRKVKAITGQSAVEFIRTVRLKKAAQLVIEKRLSFTEIAFETGFSSLSYFTKCFHDHFGKTPSDFALEYGNRNEGKM